MLDVTHDKVAVVPLENPDKIGSLWVPEIAKTRLNQGFVKYIGPEVVDCYVGQYVLFSAYTGTLVHIQGEGKLIIMPEEFVVAELLQGELETAMIPGVYFRGTIERDKQFKELWEIMEQILPGLEVEQLRTLVSQMCLRGVIGPESNPFFTANYELMMEYIARKFGDDLEFRNRIRVIEPRPELSAYDKTRTQRRQA